MFLFKIQVASIPILSTISLPFISTYLIQAKGIQVFKIPPRSTNKGYKAQEWDVSAHIWTGKIRIVENGDQCLINLEDPQNGQLFVQSIYDAQNTNAVEAVTDSSRYFVLKVQDPQTKRHAFLGIGFQERNDSFDFNVALQDHLKHVQQQKSEKGKVVTDKPLPEPDFSLKQGEQINISFKPLKKKTDANKF